MALPHPVIVAFDERDSIQPGSARDRDPEFMWGYMFYVAHHAEYTVSWMIQLLMLRHRLGHVTHSCIWRPFSLLEDVDWCPLTCDETLREVDE